MLRAASNSPASTSSLTALALAPGALNTGMPRLLKLGDRDVVDAGAGAADGAHRVRDRHLVHVGGAHQDGVGLRRAPSATS